MDIINASPKEKEEEREGESWPSEKLTLYMGRLPGVAVHGPLPDRDDDYDDGAISNA